MMRYLDKLALLLLCGSILFLGRNIAIEHNISPSSQSAAIAPNCRVVRHLNGETCIPRNPQRIVTLWLGSLSSAWALGIKPIASTGIPNEPFPAYLIDGDKIEYLGTVAEPNLEKILLLKPDLIISNTILKRLDRILSKIAPTIVVNTPAPPLPWQNNLINVAQPLQKERESQAIIDRYWQRIDRLKRKLAQRSQPLKVSVITVNPPYGIFTYGLKHPTGRLLKDLGLERPLAQTGDFFTKDGISSEALLDVDGDVIFLSHRGGNAAKERLVKLQQSRLWQSLTAVKNNRVYVVNSENWYAFDVLAMNEVLNDLEKSLF